MPLPVLPGVLRITAGGNMGGGGRWSNTWHAQNDSLVDFTEAAITAFDAIFKQIYTGSSVGGGTPQTGYWSTLTTLDSIAYTPLNGTSGAFLIASPAAGIATRDCLPPEVSEVVTVRTAARGRQNRGRVFLPAWESGGISAVGHLRADWIAATLLQVQGVALAIITGGAHLGVGSYGPYRDPVTHALVPGTPHFTAANNFTMDDLFDVQRSRKT